MENSHKYLVLFILAMATATFITRIIPFMFFSRLKNSRTLNFVGHFLPLMVMPILVVYSLKDTTIVPIRSAVPEAIAAMTVIAIHTLKSHALLSIGIGSATYVLLKHYL